MRCRFPVRVRSEWVLPTVCNTLNYEEVEGARVSPCAVCLASLRKGPRFPGRVPAAGPTWIARTAARRKAAPVCVCVRARGCRAGTDMAASPHSSRSRDASLEEGDDDSVWEYLEACNDSASVVGYEAIAPAADGIVRGVVNAVTGAAGVLSGSSGADDVVFVVESNTSRVKRTFSEFQKMRTDLQFRFPKSRLPVLPARRLGNHIRSIGETVGAWGETLGMP